MAQLWWGWDLWGPYLTFVVGIGCVPPRVVVGEYCRYVRTPTAAPLAGLCLPLWLLGRPQELLPGWDLRTEPLLALPNIPKGSQSFFPIEPRVTRKPRQVLYLAMHDVGAPVTS